jgi:AcrR family transcriptional regulator
MQLETRLANGGVLAAALGLFERQGVAATRVEDILEAANIARRTFYRHFKSKEDVLVALYAAAMGEILTAIRDREIEADAAQPLAGIHHAIDVYLDYHVHNAGTLRVLLGQAVRSDSPLFAMRQTFRSTLVKILTEVARKTHKDLAPLVFIAMVSALEGMSLEMLETGIGPGDIETARQTAHALLAKVFDTKGPPFPRARRRRS